MGKLDIVMAMLVIMLVVTVGVGIAAYNDGTQAVANYACIEAGFDSGTWENEKIICQKLKALVGE